LDTIHIGSDRRDRPKTACGAGAPTVIIGSVGTSNDSDSIEAELAKVERAQELGATAVTDHSFYGDIAGFHRAIADHCDVILSVVTCYAFAAHYEKRQWRNVSPELPAEILRDQLERGVDMVTVHATPRRVDVLNARDSKRVIPTTSKGGGIISSYIRATGRENPYYEYYDTVLNLLRSYGATLSLGNTFRAASVVDGWDRHMAQEIHAQGELVKRAQQAGVPVMVEGFGHADLAAIPTYIRLTKAICHGAPYRILPMSTDRALGYDHISGAIATATAVSFGADAVSAMSRAEHIGLPSTEDLEEALIATRIAATAGELVKLGDTAAEHQMSRTRWAQGCKGDWTTAVYPRGAELALHERGRLNDQLIQCGMCGDFCGIASGLATVASANRKPRTHQ
jgi:phosphomethylpyrimidine synthase